MICRRASTIGPGRSSVKGRVVPRSQLRSPVWMQQVRSGPFSRNTRVSRPAARFRGSSVNRTLGSSHAVFSFCCFGRLSCADCLRGWWRHFIAAAHVAAGACSFTATAATATAFIDVSYPGGDRRITGCQCVCNYRDTGGRSLSIPEGWLWATDPLSDCFSHQDAFRRRHSAARRRWQIELER